jgi:hypothetical protein
MGRSMRCGYHFTVKSVSFGKGQSAVAKAAYNSRTQLDNERDGRKTKDYSDHGEVLFSGIFAPEGAPEWAHDRNQIWNRAEAAERQQKNGQPARNVDCAFPHELNQQQREWMLKDFVREQFARKGMVADAVIHPPHPEGDERNFHAHILLTMRKLEGDEFAKTKCREWNSKEALAQWKEQWAEKGAKALHRAGYSVEAERWRHGHKTLPEQQKAALARGDKEFAESLQDREPTRHKGPKTTGLERRGAQSDRLEELQPVGERNNLLSQMRQIDREIAELERQAAARQQPEYGYRVGPAMSPRELAERQKRREAAFGAKQEAWRVSVEENNPEKVKPAEKGAHVAKTGLQVADKATGAVMSLADFMSGLVSGHTQQAPVQERDKGGVGGFIHDDPKLRKEQQLREYASIKAAREADNALERIEEDMKKGKALSASDIQNLTPAHQMTLRHFGDDGMRQLVEAKQNERYWKGDGREMD